MPCKDENSGRGVEVRTGEKHNNEKECSEDKPESIWES